MNVRRIQSIALKIAEGQAAYATKRIAEEMEKQTKAFIKEFYSEYTPTLYHRTKNLYHACRQYHTKKDDTYWGGIELNAKYLFDNYKAAPYKVAYFTLFQGYHALPSQIHYTSVVKKIKKYRCTLAIKQFLREGLKQSIQKYASQFIH